MTLFDGLPNFLCTRLKQANLTTIVYITDFMEKLNFNKKLEKINNTVTLNKKTCKGWNKTKWSKNFLQKTSNWSCK